MNLALIYQLVTLLLVIAFLIWLVWKHWPHHALPPVAPVPESLSERIQRIHVRIIMERGGPHSLDEYLAIFPGACPVCGSRTIAEAKAMTSFPADPIPLAPPVYGVEGCWWCPRCHAESAPGCRAKMRPSNKCPWRSRSAMKQGIHCALS